MGSSVVSEDLTNKLQGKELTLDTNNVTYTFVTKKTIKPLTIMLQSNPLITDDELQSIFKGFKFFFGNIVKIVKQGHKFANHIDSGLRKILLTLDEGVQTRDIPGSIGTSDGVETKLLF